MISLAIINGPNLNGLGQREPDIYGQQNFEHYFKDLKLRLADTVMLEYAQTNHEGQYLDLIQRMAQTSQGLILNPGAYTHTSLAIRDAVAALSIPVVEVHISDIAERESFRHHSYLKGIAYFTVKGLGIKGYEVAIRRLLEFLTE